MLNFREAIECAKKGNLFSASRDQHKKTIESFRMNDEMMKWWNDACYVKSVLAHCFPFTTKNPPYRYFSGIVYSWAGKKVNKPELNVIFISNEDTYLKLNILVEIL